MTSPSRLARRTRFAAIAALTLSLAPNAGSIASAAGQPPTGRPFNGFNERFNLGRGAASGAVCEARRAFDDPLAGQGARVWDVTCRGWSQRLGKLYLFPGPGGARTQAVWRAGLASRADCGSGGGGVQSCKTKPAGLDYAVVTADPAGPKAAGEGLAGVSDLLAVGVRFLEGRTSEPAAVAEVSASVGKAAGAHVGELTQIEQAETPDARLLDGYRRGEDWRFGDAEARFSTVAAAQGTSAAQRAEALYNAALNASDDERFAQADEDFREADALAARGGNAALENQALDYKAAHARNQGRFETAIGLADQAIKAHLGAVRAATVTMDGTGGLVIADQSTAADTGGLTPTQREALRAVQDLQIKATSLEALDRGDEARAALAQARSILDVTISAKSARHPRSLGEASPWLDVRIRADTARLAQGSPGGADALGALRVAVDNFAISNPDTLPLASFRMELARTEMLEANDAAARERSLSDYEAAFAIFRAQRGSLTASADFTRPYFDALLARIGDNPGAHAKDVERFFDAAQSLISQSSADAAKRQAENIRVGDQKAAGLARALEDTSRQYDALTAQRAEAIRNGSYQGAQKTEIDTRLTRLAADRNLLEAQLLNADPRYASALNNLVSVDALQKQLRPGEVYLKVFLLASQGYGVLISPTAARVYGVDISRRDGAELMEAVRPKVASVHTKAGERKRVVAFDVARAHEAFTTLFGPVATDLLAAKHVIYEPDVTLIVVPFATYVVDDASVEAMKANLELARTGSAPLTYTGVHWLGAQVSSSIALSAPAFVQARVSAPSTASGAFYGFGDPQILQDDPREFADVRALGSDKGQQTFCDVVRLSLLQMSALPETADEVATVARGLGQGPQSYAVGPAFTDSDILRRGGPDGDLRHYRVLYFATHGIMSTETRGCMQTALLTSPGDGDSDALLDVVKIPNLHLNADMVVLSACDTGVSSGGNETLGGLVTSFVQAGARNLVVSNWHVESKATQELMSTMFAQKGVSQADALAIAERAMMSGGRYSHPYFWAPFVVVGDGAKAMPGGWDGPTPQASESRPLSGPAPAP
jgi:CHAT domain-containing protein